MATEPTTQATHDRVGRSLDKARSTVPIDTLLLAQSILARRYQSLRLTPEQVRNVLARADIGYFGEAIDMYEVFSTSDPETGSAVEKRRNGIRKAKRTLTPADDSPAAEAVKDYVQLILDNLIGWDSLILDLEPGNYNGFMGIEIEWNGLYPVALHQTANDDWRWQSGLRVLEPKYSDYVGLLWRDARGQWQPTPQDKFIINTNTSLPIARRGCMRQIAGVWSTKKILEIVLDTFCELYGTPRTIISVPDEWSGNTASMNQLVENMMKLGQDGYALVSELVNIIALNHQGSEHVPTLQVLQHKARQISKAILGSTLTSDTTGATGTYSAAAVHLEAELDIAEADLEQIARAINRDLIAPIVWYGPSQGEYCPTLNLSIRNPARERANLEMLKLAREAGMAIPAEYASELTGIPLPEDGEDIVGGGITKETEGEDNE